MPTEELRRQRIRENRMIIALISSMIVLILLGFARIYTVTTDLRDAQATACALRAAGRADINTHDRAPLRAALRYLGAAVVKAAAQQPDPVKRAQALAFGRAFLTYAAAVKPLPNPTC